MKKIKFALVGPGKIANSFVKGIKHLDNAELIAVVSRDINRAQTFAGKYNIKYAYDDLEACLNNEEVDALYISTPPFMHYENAMLALSKKKHVLCEKPFTVDVEELKKLQRYAKKQKVMLMEAMKAPFIPVNQIVKQLLKEEIIGEIICLDGSFTYDGGPRYNHFHFKNNAGGGALYDVGIYPLAICLYFIESKVKKVIGLAKKAPTGVDSLSSLLVQFENGAIASIRGGLEVNTYKGITIYGKNGKITIPEFWVGKKATIDFYDGRNSEVIEKDASDEFKFQIGHFVECIQQNKLESEIMSYDFSLKIMKIMTKIVKEWRKEK